MQALSFWDRLNPRLPEESYYFHPVRFVECFNTQRTDLKCKECGITITLTEEFLKKIMPRAQRTFIDELILCSTELFPKYGVNTCRQIKHLLAQAKKETTEFTAFRENLRYVSGGAVRAYDLSPRVINAGFARKGMTFISHRAKLDWIQENLINNDPAYGEHCYGTNEQPGKDFRGRGLIHLTHYETYQRCARETGHPIDSHPELVENNTRIIIETGLWFWKDRNLAAIANNIENGGDEGVRKITRAVTGAAAGLPERQVYKRQITSIFDQYFSSRCLG